jgi:hypothetical protein
VFTTQGHNKHVKWRMSDIQVTTSAVNSCSCGKSSSLVTALAISSSHSAVLDGFIALRRREISYGFRRFLSGFGISARILVRLSQFSLFEYPSSALSSKSSAHSGKLPRQIAAAKSGPGKPYFANSAPLLVGTTPALLGDLRQSVQFQSQPLDTQSRKTRVVATRWRLAAIRSGGQNRILRYHIDYVLYFGRSERI